MVKRAQPFSPHSTAVCAKTFDVLANETRLGVVGVLFEGSRYVNELEALLGVDQSLLSHHLRVLRDAGIVQVAVDGKKRLYSLAIARSGDGRALDFGCCELSFAERLPEATRVSVRRRRES